MVRKHITEAMADVDREQSQKPTLPQGQAPPYDVETT